MHRIVSCTGNWLDLSHLLLDDLLFFLLPYLFFNRSSDFFLIWQEKKPYVV